MDTSETYIKMCEKAEEIQGQRILEIGDYYAYHNQFGYLVIGSDSFPETAKRVFIGGCIWLPRQDQLQEMISNDIQVLCRLIYDMGEFGGYPFGRNFASMEQLWLAFVMKERYSQIWNGTEWTKS